MGEAETGKGKLEIGKESEVGCVRGRFSFVDAGLVEAMCHLTRTLLKTKRVRHPKADVEIFDGSNLSERKNWYGIETLLLRWRCAK
jgi:hypothetical protein